MKPPGVVDDDDKSSDELLRLEGRMEGRELQLKINKHMTLNKFWKNWEGHNRSTHPVPIEMYPAVLEVLAQNLCFCISFLRERDPALLFG